MAALVVLGVFVLLAIGFLIFFFSAEDITGRPDLTADQTIPEKIRPPLPPQAFQGSPPVQALASALDARFIYSPYQVTTANDRVVISVDPRALDLVENSDHDRGWRLLISHTPDGFLLEERQAGAGAGGDGSGMGVSRSVPAFEASFHYRLWRENGKWVRQRRFPVEPLKEVGAAIDEIGLAKAPAISRHSPWYMKLAFVVATGTLIGLLIWGIVALVQALN